METNGAWADARSILELFLGIFLFVVAGAFLTSIGGLGIYASPVTLPLLLLAVWRHPTLPFRIAGAVIGGLTAAEGMWGLIYWIAGEAPIVSWLLPLVSGVATAFGFLQIRKKYRHSRSVQTAN